MVLDKGVLKSRPIKGRQTIRKPKSKINKGLSLGNLKRLVATSEPRICIVRSLGGIGDVLMTTPTIRALRHEWPQGRITYATDFNYMDGALKDILRYNPYIDEVIRYQVAFNKEYDFFADVTSLCVGEEKLGGSVPNRIDLFADYVGVSLAETGFLPDYIVSEEETKWAKEKLARYPLRTRKTFRVGIQARSSTLARSWPLERVRELAMRLVNEGIQVVVFDSSHGQGPREDWNLAGVIAFKDYGIREIAALINEMDLMITPDSGLMHIAGALNKKIVSIWAGTDPESRINHYPNAIAVAKTEYKCFPCWYNPAACQNNYNCIKSITVDEVLDDIMTHLHREHVVPSVSDTVPVEYKNFLDESLKRDKRILINRCSGFGDVLMCTALAKTIKQRYPDMHVGFRTNQTDILKGIPEIDEIIHGTFESTPGVGLHSRYGHIIDLNFAVESSRVSGSRGQATEEEYMNMPRIELFYRKAGLEMGEFPGLAYHILDEEKEQAEEKIREFVHDKTVLYVINSMSPYRSYPVDGTVEVIKDLCQDFNVIGIGNMDDIWPYPHRFSKTFHEHIDELESYSHMTSLSLRDKVALMSVVDLVITPDTGMLHAAAAIGVPCIGLFGNIHPNLRASFYPNVSSLFVEQTCFADCGDRMGFMGEKCPSYQDIKDNKKQMVGAECMRAIDPQEIIWLARKILTGDKDGS